MLHGLVGVGLESDVRRSNPFTVLSSSCYGVAVARLTLELVAVVPPSMYRMKSEKGFPDEMGASVMVSSATSQLLRDFSLLGGHGPFPMNLYSRVSKLLSLHDNGATEIIRQCHICYASIPSLLNRPASLEDKIYSEGGDSLLGPDIGDILRGLCRNISLSMPLLSPHFDKFAFRMTDRQVGAVFATLAFVSCCAFSSDDPLTIDCKEVFMDVLLAAGMPVRSAAMECLVGLLASLTLTGGTSNTLMDIHAPLFTHMGLLQDLPEGQALLSRIKKLPGHVGEIAPRSVLSHKIVTD